MVNTPVRPELSPTEVSVLQKAQRASTKHSITVTGDEAKVAATLMGDETPKSWGWGPPHHHPHWGRGPWVTGYPDGQDIVLGGLTAAGLMVLDDWLNRRRDNEPVEPQEAEPGEEPEEYED